MTGWALAFGIIGTITGLTSLLISYKNYRASGPNIKVSVSRFGMMGGPRRGGVVAVNVVNRGRTAAAIKYVVLRSISSSAAVAFDEACDEGPALPLILAPTDSMSWNFYDNDLRRRLSGSNPGEFHNFRAHVRSAGKVIRSRSRVSFATDKGASRRTRRERLASLRNSLLYAALQEDGAATTPECLALGRQRLTLRNFSKSPAFNVRVDCVVSDEGSGTSRVATEIQPQRLRLLLPRTRRHVWLAVDPPNIEVGETIMWRYRWRGLRGGERWGGSGMIDRSTYQAALKADRPLVAPGLAGDSHPIPTGRRTPRALRRLARDESPDLTHRAPSA